MIRYLVAAALFGLATQASAGTRAIYASDEGGKQLTIEVADNGDARISDGSPGEYGLMLGGHFYIVGTQDGALKVARIEDVASAIDQVIPPVFKGMLSAPAATPKGFRAEKKGARDVAGQPGTVYAVYGLNSDKPAEAQEFVMSSDPKLKPVGAAMEQFMNAAVVPAAPLIGNGAAEIVAQTHAIFALGTPLDVGRFKLTSLESADVPPAKLALPGKPISTEELVRDMKAAQLPQR
ncbi:MAG TPA: hypothetical protein VNZ43_11855 [Sphingomonadaceae bacterium]|jgi:hypothetical protein|nr:hypothetical protein [Sphingomonadaceae bacterium]